MKFLIIIFISMISFNVSATAADDRFTFDLNYESSKAKYRWNAGAWTSCDRYCGTGIVQTRTVSCIDVEGVAVSPSLCQYSEPPIQQRPCEDLPDCSWEQACISNSGNGSCNYTSPICMTGVPSITVNAQCEHSLSGAGPNPGTSGPCISSCPAPPPPPTVCTVTVVPRMDQTVENASGDCTGGMRRGCELDGGVLKNVVITKRWTNDQGKKRCSLTGECHIETCN